MRGAVGLTILSRPWRPDPKASNNKGAKRKPNGDYPTKPELASKMLDLIIARFPDRAIELVGDSWFASGFVIETGLENHPSLRCCWGPVPGG